MLLALEVPGSILVSVKRATVTPGCDSDPDVRPRVLVQNALCGREGGERAVKALCSDPVTRVPFLDLPQTFRVTLQQSLRACSCARRSPRPSDLTT